MRNIIFISLAFMLVSCSSNSDGNDNSNLQITPPNWIQGTWVLENNGMSSFKFKPDDFCSTINQVELCNAQNLKIISQSGGESNVKQVITDKEYEISITMQSSTVTYHFFKIDATKIQWVASGDLKGIYIKK